MRTEVRMMDKAGTIAYAIRKECCMYSLKEWCYDWGFTINDFNKFLALGEEEFRKTGDNDD